MSSAKRAPSDGGGGKSKFSTLNLNAVFKSNTAKPVVPAGMTDLNSFCGDDHGVLCSIYPK